MMICAEPLENLSVGDAGGESSRVDSVQRRESQQVGVGFYRRHPPLKHHPTRARHREQIAIPGWFGGVGGHGTVWAVVRDEVGEIAQWCHATMRSGLQ